MAVEQLHTPANLAIETAYFAEPDRRGFERPYGWAWLLKLAEELLGWDDPDAQRWPAAVAPLAELIVERYLEFLPRLTYPIRSGAHSSTAFGLTFALDYAVAADRGPLRELIVARSLDYYGADRDAPAAWEPGGGDFLPGRTRAKHVGSPGIAEHHGDGRYTAELPLLPLRGRAAAPAAPAPPTTLDVRAAQTPHTVYDSST